MQPSTLAASDARVATTDRPRGWSARRKIWFAAAAAILCWAVVIGLAVALISVP